MFSLLQAWSFVALLRHGSKNVSAARGALSHPAEPISSSVWSCNQVQRVTWQFAGSDVLRWEIAYSLNSGPFVTVNNQIPGPDRLYFFFPPFVVSNTPIRLRLRKVGSNGAIQDTISNVFTLGNF